MSMAMPTTRTLILTVKLPISLYQCIGSLINDLKHVIEPVWGTLMMWPFIICASEAVLPVRQLFSTSSDLSTFSSNSVKNLIFNS